MDLNRRRLLEATIALVQRRWGSRALRTLSGAGPEQIVASIPTGFSDLDAALGIGGLPRGRITELLGAPTSGMTTLALQVIAGAQAAGDVAAYLDLGGTFDAEYASWCGVRLPTLLLIRPEPTLAALEIAHTLIDTGVAGVLVVDSLLQLLAEPRGAGALSAALRRLPAPLADSPSALIFLTPLPSGVAVTCDQPGMECALPHYAALRLLVVRERWLTGHHTINGAQARVTIVKNRLAPSERQATIKVAFQGGAAQ